jgi:hypothetical protein
MKQFKIVFPVKMAEQFATFSITAKIRILLNWTEGGGDFFGFDDPKIVAICAIEDADLEDFKKSDYFKFVKQ